MFDKLGEKRREENREIVTREQIEELRDLKSSSEGKIERTGKVGR